MEVLVVGLFGNDESAEQEKDEAAPAHGIDAQLVAGQGQDDAGQEQAPGDPGKNLPVFGQLLVFRFDVQKTAHDKVGADDQEQKVQGDASGRVVLEHAEDGQGAGNAGQAEVKNIDKFALQAKVPPMKSHYSRF